MSLSWGLGARRTTRAIMQMGFRFGCLVWNIHITIQGTLSTARPLLLISNHFSYVDLFVMGSRIPAAFTPKSDIASWPVIGLMCKVAGCLFIDRRVSQTGHNKILLEKALRAGDIISLFPEGTTNDGTKLLPFKSALFSIAEAHDLTVQPVSILYTHVSGRPLEADSLEKIGWFGDTSFFPHLLQLLRERSIAATLILHSAVHSSTFPTRKALAVYCQNTVEQPFRLLPYFTFTLQKNAPELLQGREEPNNGV